MYHSRRRCSLRPQSVGAPTIEHAFVERVLTCIPLDARWQEAVLTALANEGPKQDHSLELNRIDAALANLRKQHLWGVLTDEEFRAEFQNLERQRKAMVTQPPPVQLPNRERAAELLQDLPSLWRHPGVKNEQRREFAREVFEEVRIRKGRLVAVKPKTPYAPLFAYSIWRQNAMGHTRAS